MPGQVFDLPLGRRPWIALLALRRAAPPFFGSHPVHCFPARDSIAGTCLDPPNGMAGPQTLAGRGRRSGRWRRRSLPCGPRRCCWMRTMPMWTNPGPTPTAPSRRHPDDWPPTPPDLIVGTRLALVHRATGPHRRTGNALPARKPRDESPRDDRKLRGRPTAEGAQNHWAAPNRWFHMNATCCGGSSPGPFGPVAPHSRQTTAVTRSPSVARPDAYGGLGVDAG